MCGKYWQFGLHYYYIYEGLAVTEKSLSDLHALCSLNIIPHWLNTGSTLAVQKIFNGNKYITPKYKYKYKYFGCKYKYKYKYFTYKYKYNKYKYSNKCT